LFQRREILVPHYTVAVTLLAVALYFFISTRVATARARFGVKLPATTGNPDFERIFRVHQNTLEWLPTFLVPLWLCALYLNDAAAAVLGLIWIGGRILYYLGYREAARKRLPGFYIQTVACLLLFSGAIAGLVMHW
jgi:glutathione S-transferase